MHYLYVDEQEAKLAGRNSFSIIGLLIPANRVIDIKRSYYAQMHPIISKGGFVSPIPILHGSNLLPEYDDGTKIEAVRIVFDTLKNAGARLFRWGYFDDPAARVKSKNEKLFRCLSDVMFGMARQGVPYIIIHELDIEAARKNYLYLTQAESILYLQEAMDWAFPAEMFSNCLAGHFLASKSDVIMQMADVAGYAAMKAHKRSLGERLSEFSSYLADASDRNKECFSCNEVNEPINEVNYGPDGQRV